MSKIDNNILMIWTMAIALVSVAAWSIWSVNNPQPVVTSIVVSTPTAPPAMDNSFYLEARVSPPASKLGDIVALKLSLRNAELADLSSIQITIPEGLQPVLNQLPRQAIFEPSTQQIRWTPLSAELTETFHFTVSSFYSDAPEQLLELSWLYAGESMSQAVAVWSGNPPRAQLSINSLQAAVGQPLKLQPDVEGSGPITQQWDLGDGRVIVASDPTVVYSQIGIYEIILTISNPLESYEVRQQIEITGKPAAFFRISDTTPIVGQEIIFESMGGGAKPIQYQWDFGDGAFSTDPNPAHSYLIPGMYQVKLTLYNQYGEAQNDLMIVVGNTPVADMTIDKKRAAGELLSAQAYLDDTVTKVVWQMGDGHEYEGETVAHIYQQPGDYFVTMTAYNSFGNTVVSKIVQIGGQLENRTDLALIVTRDAIIPSGVAGGSNINPITIEFESTEIDILLEPNPPVDVLPPTDQLMWYINEARHQAGLKPVAWQQELSLAAKVHADDMALNQFTAHTGSDGSQPYERLARVNYRGGGYAGETTAWGFNNGREVVTFWLESPPHRAILLNPIADQVGVAQTTNYNAPSVWYWTAEFASTYGSLTNQLYEAGIRWIKPTIKLAYTFEETAILTWDWSLPLENREKFVIYVQERGAYRKVAQIKEPLPEASYTYGLSIGLTDLVRREGEYEFVIALEDQRGEILTITDPQPFVVEGVHPTDTPLPTSTLMEIATQTPTLTFTPTATGTTLPSSTPTVTATTLPTITSTPTETRTLLPSSTPTVSSTPTMTATYAVTVTSTMTPMNSLTVTPVSIPSPSFTPTATFTITATPLIETPLPTPILTLTPTANPSITPEP